jgi:hypothetical protein
MVAIIGGETRRFRPLGIRTGGQADAGHPPERLKGCIRRFVAGATGRPPTVFRVGEGHDRYRKERGQVLARRDFDARVGPDGAFLIGNRRNGRKFTLVKPQEASRA